MDRKPSTARLLILAGLLSAVLLTYLGVLVDTQVVHHADYLAQSIHSIAREERVEASRGIITDRSGRTLVSNSSAYDLTFDVSLLDDGEEQNLAILRLVELCQKEIERGKPELIDCKHNFRLDPAKVQAELAEVQEVTTND